MITKIQPPAANITNALMYNEKKMTGSEMILTPEDEKLFLSQNESGHIVATFNVPNTSTLENEFTRLRWLNRMNTKGRKLENPTFHLSINPGESDVKMTEQKIAEFAKELMTELGYEDTPFRLYRHNDIEREHYHIVGIRIGQDGKKINDSYEHKKCERITRELAQKYGFTYGLEQPEKKAQPVEKTNTTTEDTAEPLQNPSTKKENKNEQKTGKQYIPPYKKSADISDAEQYRNIHNEAIRWSFTTPEQYAHLLKYRFNTDVEIYGDSLQFTGLDDKGDDATTPMTEGELNINAMNDMLTRIANTDMKPKKNQRQRLEKTIRETIEEADNWKDFKNRLLKKGIITAVSWNTNDEPFGITWMDRGTKCIWKASETETDLNWIKEKIQEKNWKIVRHYKYEKYTTSTNGNNKKTLNKINGRNTRLSDYSEKNELQKLMERKNIRQTRRSNADASKNKPGIKYGDENNEHDIII